MFTYDAIYMMLNEQYNGSSASTGNCICTLLDCSVKKEWKQLDYVLHNQICDPLPFISYSLINVLYSRN